MTSTKRPTYHDCQVQRKTNEYIVKGIGDLILKGRNVLTATDAIREDDSANKFKNKGTEIRILP